MASDYSDYCLTITSGQHPSFAHFRSEFSGGWPAPAIFCAFHMPLQPLLKGRVWGHRVLQVPLLINFHLPATLKASRNGCQYNYISNGAVFCITPCANDKDLRDDNSSSAGNKPPRLPRKQQYCRKEKQNRRKQPKNAMYF